MILLVRWAALRFVLGAIFVLGQSMIYAGLADYAIPDGYCLHTQEDGARTIKMLRRIDGKPDQCMGWVTIIWQKQAGQCVTARIKHLEVDSRLRGCGVGSKLFDFAVYTLIKTVGAKQVSWCAQPLDSSRSLSQLIAFYEKRGGVMSDVVPRSGAMCLSLKKLTDIDISESPTADVDQGEFIETDTRIDQKIALKSNDRYKKNQCILRCFKLGNDRWSIEKPYHYTLFGIEQYKILESCIVPISEAGIL